MATWARVVPSRRLIFTVMVAACTMMIVIGAPVAAGAPRIAFVAGSQAQIWTIAADGSGPRQLTEGSVAVAGPAWSRDHKTIAYLRGSGSAAYYREVWVMRADGSDQHKLSYSGPSLSNGSRALAYSKNGRYLAGGCRLPGQGKWAVTVLDRKTGKSRIVCRFRCENGVQSLSWSRDGRRLAASIEYGGGYGMLMIDVPKARLVKEYGGYASVSWRPDGRYLLCHLVRVGESSVTCLLRPDGTKAGRLGTKQNEPTYSPDGTHYAFASNSGVLKVAESDGSNVKTVYRGKRVWQLAWK
jgi:Tol biopolymer transport system component